MNINDFRELASRGIVLLDGGTGSYMRRMGMPVGVSSEEWILKHPDLLIGLQRGYVAAGSRIVFAPTFMCNRVGLANHGLEKRVDELNRRLVALSREAVGDRAYIAGDMTTTGRALEPYGDMSYGELIDIYAEQARALVQAGVDLIGGETLLTLEEASALVEAVRSVSEDIPVMCTMTIQADGTLMYGGSILDVIETMQALGVSAVGLNCSTGPDQLEATVRAMIDAAEIPVIVKPNAGMPTMDEKGMAHYSMNETDFVNGMLPLAAAGVNLLGGCCGSDPNYIAKLGDALEEKGYTLA